MNKIKTIEDLKKGHKVMSKAINQLSGAQMVKEKVCGDWTVKDVLSHISTWDSEILKAVNEVLKNQRPWFWYEENPSDVDDFNKRVVELSKDKSLRKVIQEWESSFEALMKRVDILSDEEFLHDSGHKWKDGTPLTVASLFEYYEGEGHEAGHARELINALHLRS